MRNSRSKMGFVNVSGRRDTPGHRPRVMVSWDEDVFDLIKKVAKKKNISFSACANGIIRKTAIRAGLIND